MKGGENFPILYEPKGSHPSAFPHLKISYPLGSIDLGLALGRSPFALQNVVGRHGWVAVTF